MPTSVLLAVLAAAGLLALAPALTRRYDVTERVAEERATSTARVLSRRRRRRTVPGSRPINPPRYRRQSIGTASRAGRGDRLPEPSLVGPRCSAAQPRRHRRRWPLRGGTARRARSRRRPLYSSSRNTASASAADRGAPPPPRAGRAGAAEPGRAGRCLPGRTRVLDRVLGLVHGASRGPRLPAPPGRRGCPASACRSVVDRRGSPPSRPPSGASTSAARPCERRPHASPPPPAEPPTATTPSTTPAAPSHADPSAPDSGLPLPDSLRGIRSRRRSWSYRGCLIAKRVWVSLGRGGRTRRLPGRRGPSTGHRSGLGRWRWRESPQSGRLGL